jgi:hypothetical protein
MLCKGTFMGAGAGAAWGSASTKPAALLVILLFFPLFCCPSRNSAALPVILLTSLSPDSGRHKSREGAGA